MCVEGGGVGGGAVAFMFGKSIGGVMGIVVTQQGVARGFSEDRGGRYGGLCEVSLDDGGRIAEQASGAIIAIDEGMAGRRAELFDGAAHGEVGGLSDVEGVDVLRTNVNHRPSDCALLNEGGEAVSFALCQLLGVG